MPVALDPNATYRFSLRSDADRPEAERPAFILRHMSARRWRELSAWAEDSSAIKTMTSREVLDKLQAEIARQLVGWSNMAGPDGAALVFAAGPAALDDLLTMGEHWELFYAMLAGERLGADDAKKSASPSPAGSDIPAGAAGPATAASKPG